MTRNTAPFSSQVWLILKNTQCNSVNKSWSRIVWLSSCATARPQPRIKIWLLSCKANLWMFAAKTSSAQVKMLRIKDQTRKIDDFKRCQSLMNMKKVRSTSLQGCGSSSSCKKWRGSPERAAKVYQINIVNWCLGWLIPVFIGHR